MGGKKKLTLKQMERMRQRRDEKGGGKSGGRVHERRMLGIDLPDPRSEKVVNELKRMKVLTPYTVATRFNIRLSVARDLLEELEKRHVVEYVSGSKSIKIYKPHD